jgi:hypothetical protein
LNNIKPILKLIKKVNYDDLADLKDEEKFFRKHIIKDLEQEQLIINHSLTEECRKHNIDPQFIKLIPVSLNAIHFESTVDYNLKYSFSENEEITKRYNRWLKKKRKN